jgi:hypothetical protein
MTSDDDWPTNCLPKPNTPRPAKPTGIETIFAERATVELGISVSVISFFFISFLATRLLFREIEMSAN